MIRAIQSAFLVLSVIAANGAFAAVGDTPTAPAQHIRPVVADILQYTPEGVVIAAGIPSLDEMKKQFESYDDLMKLFGLPQEEDGIPIYFQSMFQVMGVDTMHKISDMLKHGAIDTQKPLGMFYKLDFSPEKMSALVHVFQEMEKAGNSPENFEEVMQNNQEFQKKIMEFMPFNFSLILPLTSPENVKAANEKWAKENPDESAKIEKQSFEVEGKSLEYSTDGKTYWMDRGSQQLFATNLDMLRELHIQMNKPRDFGFLSANYPASAQNEFVYLCFMQVFLDYFKAFDFKSFFEEIDKQFPESKTTEADMKEFNEFVAMLESFGVSLADPLVMAATMAENSISAKFSVNLAAYPILAEIMGNPSPNKRLALLPKDSIASFSLSLADSTKAQLQSYLAPMLEEATKSGNPIGGMGGQAFTMLGNEVAFALTSIENVTPKGIALVHLAQPEQANALLGFFMAQAKMEEYKECPIRTMQMDPETVACVAVYRDVLIAGLNLDDVKKTIDLIESGEDSALPGAKQSPADAYPSYYFFSKLRFAPLIKMARDTIPGLPEEIGNAVDAFLNAGATDTEFRLMVEKSGDWAQLKYELNAPMEEFMKLYMLVMESGYLDTLNTFEMEGEYEGEIEGEGEMESEGEGEGEGEMNVEGEGEEAEEVKSAELALAN